MLYVGLTRAAERLVIAGVAPATRRCRADSWHARTRDRARRRSARMATDRAVGRGAQLARRRAARATPRAPRRAASARSRHAARLAAAARAPIEARPPRPLGAVGDQPRTARHRRRHRPSCAPPRERGTLLHSLFERLPAVAPAERRPAALRWLEARPACPSLTARGDRRRRVAGHRRSALRRPVRRGRAGRGADRRDLARWPRHRRHGRPVVHRRRLRPRDRLQDRALGACASVAQVPPGHRAQMQAYAEALGGDLSRPPDRGRLALHLTVPR